MKIALTSDVHLEFGPLEIYNEQNADVLILSGDIITAAQLDPYDPHKILGEEHRSNRWHDFFQHVCEQFKHVVYVMGNHEHYNGDFTESYDLLVDRLSYLQNLYILEKQLIVIDGVVFYGGTLWTDMNQEDELTMHSIVRRMNDYRIRNKTRDVQVEDVMGGELRLRRGFLEPQDTVASHKEYLDGLREALAVYNDMPFVVVGHHSPSKQSTHPHYRNEHIMNGAYSSDLSEFILDNPQIKLWTHGHTHYNFDYQIGSTNVWCNPRGYDGYETQASRWELEYKEL